MTSSKEGVPVALLHNLKHNQVLHERVVLVTVETANTPYVNELDRIYLHRMDKGFMRVIIRYGFMEEPGRPSALIHCAFRRDLRDDGDHLLRLARDHHARLRRAHRAAGARACSR
jgi:K+ transporter